MGIRTNIRPVTGECIFAKRKFLLFMRVSWGRFGCMLPTAGKLVLLVAPSVSTSPIWLSMTRPSARQPFLEIPPRKNRERCLSMFGCWKGQFYPALYVLGYYVYCAFHLKWMTGLYKQHTFLAFKHLPLPAITCHYLPQLT